MSNNKSVVIGINDSQISSWQSDVMQQELSRIGISTILQNISESVDLNVPPIEETSSFIANRIEKEDALLNGKIDVAVHALKDFSIDQTEGLVLAAVSQRTDPRDCIMINNKSSDQNLPLNLKQGAKVATFSLRSKYLLLDVRNDLNINIMEDQPILSLVESLSRTFDAIVVDATTAIRLQTSLPLHILLPLHPREFVPAPAQGVLAFQCRADDFETRKMLAKIHHPMVAECTNVERSVLKMIGSEKNLSLGVYCEMDANGFYHVYACIGDPAIADLKKIAISHSTSFMLAEKVYENLTN